MTLAAVRDPEAQPRIAYVACPLCDSQNFQPYASVDCTRHPLYTPLIPAKMQWMRCDDCEHVFTEGCFNQEQQAAIFAKVQPTQVVGPDLEAKRYISGRMVERVCEVLDCVSPSQWGSDRSGRWLDVGFGDGSLLMAAQEWGFEPLGIDLREEAVAKLRETGIEAHRCDLPRLRKDWSGFSVISLADVLEHEPFPIGALQSAHHHLAQDGVLFVSCPNMDCVAWRELTKAHCNPYWLEVEHFHNFTRKRLYALLRECGFEPVRYSISERYRLGMEIIARKVDRMAGMD